MPKSDESAVKGCRDSKEEIWLLLQVRMVLIRSEQAFWMNACGRGINNVDAAHKGWWVAPNIG
jgi:hypothetical protein